MLCVAAEHRTSIVAAYQLYALPQAWSAIASAVQPFDMRTAPIVAIAAGSVAQSVARALLSAVNYEADVTWNENTYQGNKNNLPNLQLNVFLLCGILIVFASVACLAFGGIRLFFHRLLPERFLNREVSYDCISLTRCACQGAS